MPAFGLRRNDIAIYYREASKNIRVLDKRPWSKHAHKKSGRPAVQPCNPLANSCSVSPQDKEEWGSVSGCCHLRREM